ncbi:hypothetical protein I302_107146 [Kwoniella bestiolae CBS 10118]|uniref:Uncharacterized protein n=1 Tax=Kwoniella bestiolae CBS 10118 TaxID=1296100 RepID=A0A1B9FZD8_9TREE|nr:hypothetical protein I302_05588 [Kwoniella bestiolae CBS 10118]OCF24130.1 hypothetical protein I302_05588 [Kwoniella bestiolae CBS 10118]
MITSSPHPHPLLFTLPQPHPTTSLTLPTFLPHFIPFTPPPPPGRNGPKGVKIIDHSFPPPSPTPTPVFAEHLELDLARTHSNQSIDSTALITPQAQSPLTGTTLLHNDLEHHHHLPTPIMEGNHGEEGGLVFGTIHFEKRNKILPIDTFMEVQPSQITALHPHQPKQYRRTNYQPQTSFSRGEIIHHKFYPTSTLYRKNRYDAKEEEAGEDEEDQSSDTESDSDSESSGCSSIVPPDQMGKVCMYEYWRMYDQRIMEEREERRRLRKFTVTSEIEDDAEQNKSKGEGKVRDWLVSQTQIEDYTHHEVKIQDQRKTNDVSQTQAQSHSINHRLLRISINTNHTNTKTSS